MTNLFQKEDLHVICAFLICTSQRRDRMEPIFTFSESAPRALPSGRAAIENESFHQSCSTQNLPDFEELLSIGSSDRADFLHFRISSRSSTILLQLLQH